MNTTLKIAAQSSIEAEPATALTVVTSVPAATSPGYAWFYRTYSVELAQLARWNAYVCVNGLHSAENLSDYITLTVEDSLFDGKMDCGLTFTFLDVNQPELERSSYTFEAFQAMVQRFFKALPAIKRIYQARAAYRAATGAHSAEALPAIEGRAGSLAQWCRGAGRPQFYEASSCYSKLQLAAIVGMYRQRAASGVAAGTLVLDIKTRFKTKTKAKRKPVCQKPAQAVFYQHSGGYLPKMCASSASKSHRRPRG